MPARQTCPASSYWPAALRAAASRSASAKTSSGPLPPSSPVNGTTFAAAAVPMCTAVSGEPVNEMRRAPGCRVRRRADLLADPLHDVEDAGRDTRLGDEVAEERARERRPLRRLQHDGATGGERRSGLPRREHERRVPGRDHDCGPARHPDDAVPRPVRLPDALLVRDREVRVGAEVARPAGDDPCPERAEQHRHVDALDRREPLDVLVDEVGEPVQHRRAARRAERRPVGERRRQPPRTQGQPRGHRRARPRASGCASIGLRSVNVSSLATRSPPMKCSVETSTPATSTRLTTRARAPSRGRRRCSRR